MGVLVALRDAWTTIVPRRDDRHGPLPPLMITLTVVTGLVDAFSYLGLGRVFVANMTGNVVFTGFAIAGAAGFSLVASLVALAAFVCGALAGGRIAHHPRTRVHRGRMLAFALLTETALVLASYAVTLAVGAPHTTTADGTPYTAATRFTLIALLGLAMGVQNAAARALAVPDLTTTVLTLTLTGTAADSRLAGGSGSRIGRRLLSVVAMFAGALAGALCVLHGRPELPLLLAGALLACGTAAAFALARSAGRWAEPA
jgi:uncharacterized membrane protein YoaK (UPF0700 family)